MTNNNDSQSEAFNIKEFLAEALSYKYFYIASFFICLLIAFLVNKFSPTVYEVNSVIGPVEDRRSSMLGSNDLFSGLGALAESRNLENDINSLNSFSLVATTIKNLNLEVGYFAGKHTLFRSRHRYIWATRFLLLLTSRISNLSIPVSASISSMIRLTD
jgi:hypothetical protein